MLYGSENWVISQRDESWIQAVEIKFLRATAGYFTTGQEKSLTN